MPPVTRRGFLTLCGGLLLAPAVAACSQGRAAPGATGPSAQPSPAPSATTGGATPAALGTMRINWNSVSGSMSGIWMADEAGTWHDCGIEPELSNITSSSKVLPALIANDIDASALDVLVGVRGLAGGSDVVFLAAMTNRQVFSVFARPDVQRPADLAGQEWGITRVGSSTDVASHLALEQWGLAGDDITFVQLGTTANIFAALQSGQIAAGTISPPNTLMAKAAGLRELINLAEEGPEFPSVALAMMRNDMEASPDRASALVKGYALGVKRLREDRDATVAMYRKYLKIEDETVLENMWDLFRRYLAWPPVIPAAGLARVRQSAAQEEPQAANITDAQIFDGRFVEQLQAEGLFA
ncbi:MAG TPA: ABC transporter substrate-binding protein [Chloroflexota bacterium]|jgi:ABC-type nitrate/sulfonate/bicarbonate transport system substrate-binding protein